MQTLHEAMIFICTNNLETVDNSDPAFQGLQGQGFFGYDDQGQMVIVDVMYGRAVIQVLDSNTGEMLANWEVR